MILYGKKVTVHKVGYPEESHMRGSIVIVFPLMIYFLHHKFTINSKIIIEFLMRNFGVCSFGCLSKASTRTHDSRLSPPLEQ